MAKIRPPFKKVLLSLTVLALLSCEEGVARKYELIEESGVPKDAKPVPMALYNFDKDPLATPPQRFDTVALGEPGEPEWEVTNAGYAVSRPNILVQKGKATTVNSTAGLLLSNIRVDQGDISVQFRTLSLDDEQAMGIIFFYKDPEDYFILQVSSRYDACSLIRVKGKKQKLLATRNTIITPLKWHNARLVFTPQTFTFALNRELLLGGKTKGSTQAGQVGIASIANSSVAFDDLQINRDTPTPSTPNK